jgi:uncharacterized membrane protein (UPF0127 family)
MNLARRAWVVTLISLFCNSPFGVACAFGQPKVLGPSYALVGSHLIMVELAQSENERMVGLSNRDLNSRNSYMVFIFENPQAVSFWMKDTRKDLSVAFINSNNKIMQIENLAAKSLKLIKSKSSDIKYAIEVPKGFFKKKGIQIGDDVIIFK